MYVGRVIVKEFAEGVFRGNIETVRWLRSTQELVLLVVYSDGDSEEFTPTEITQYLE